MKKAKPGIQYIRSDDRIHAPCYVCGVDGLHKYRDVQASGFICRDCLSSAVVAEKAIKKAIRET